MKKFIIATCIVVLLLVVGNIAYYQLGVYIDWNPNAQVTSFVRTQGKEIYLTPEGGAEASFEIRGVDMGVGIPGEWATDYAIDEQTYLRWFAQVQELGANTIRVYTILQDDFYNAFYEYNSGREEPLYLIHGVWINDYVANSHCDAYDDALFQTLQEDCRTVVDIIHGQKTLSLGRGLGSGSYRKDISQWVIGYIVGTEWETSLVAYTNQKSGEKSSYSGAYLYTTADATPFEAMLCRTGDNLIEYESGRYKQQRLVAFSNWPITDPFVYPVTVARHQNKMTCVDVEHIKSTANFQAGMFASYHVYPYFPDYLETMEQTDQFTEEQIKERLGRLLYLTLQDRLARLGAPSIESYLQEEDYYDSDGQYNTYLAYLTALNRYHSVPVVISEYGVTTGRGMAQEDENTGRNQGHMTEQEQGQALIECYQDIMEAGCAGSCLFSWQDEWFKRTWNTWHAVDLDNTPYWSDYQTNEQFFGLLTFDPGEEQSICYVDGDLSEWRETEPVISSGDMQLSMMYDEKFLYFLVKKESFNPEEDTLYLPIDTTPKSGSTYCREHGVSFERASDFLIVIDGKENSRVLVQKRYEVLRAMYGTEYYTYDPYLNPPASDSPEFEKIYLPLKLAGILPAAEGEVSLGERYETGLLRYGNASPAAEDFDSLADFIFSGDYIEIRIPWQLLNFSNPSEMMIHDDYYEHYGIENLQIDGVYAGIGSSEQGRRVPMNFFAMKGWGKRVTSHERLKQSYYILKEYWASLDGGGEAR